MKQALCVALIAHDRKKDAMIQLAREFAAQLGGCVLLATAPATCTTCPAPPMSAARACC